MAGGRGPAPKDPGQRVRRNKPDDFETLPAEGFKGEFPPLPACYEVELDEEPDVEGEPLTVEIEYRAETREWYDTWARSPQATRFTGTDWLRLRLVIAPIVDALVRDPGNVKLASEIRLQESLIGGTVMDRQRLRWRVETPDSKPASPKRRTSSVAKRRAKLQALPGGKSQRAAAR